MPIAFIVLISFSFSTINITVDAITLNAEIVEAVLEDQSKIND